MSSDVYKPLEIDFPISDNLQMAIDRFMNHINKESGTSEDCLRSEIEFYLKENQPKLTLEQYNLLYSYYVRGELYRNVGSPWKRRRQLGYGQIDTPHA